MGLPVWCEDEAGPYQTVPYLAESWQVGGKPKKLPAEYVKNGTAKLLTLFRPANGEVRVKGVTDSKNLTLHSWMKEELSDILNSLPEKKQDIGHDENKQMWKSWQEGLTKKITLLKDPPPLKMLLVFDNLAGHYTPEFVLWLFNNGIMPLYTPLSGSWLNMAESIQKIIKRRALDGQHPQTTNEIISWLEDTAEGWNQNPTPFIWNGKRAARRKAQRERRHRVGGSGAATLKPIKYCS